MSVREAKLASKAKRPRIKRTPKPRAAKATARIPERWKIHPDYNDCEGKWYPQAATVQMLGKKVPSGCARALIDFVNARMNDNYRAGNEYSDVPVDKWTDNRKHGLATAPLSMGEIAEGVGFCLRAVEYNMADMLKRQGLARFPSEDRLFRYTVPFRHFDKVPDPEPGAKTEPEADASEADPKSEQEPRPESGQEAAPGTEPDENDGHTADGKPKPRKFRARGSKRIETPAISGLVLSEEVARQVEFDFEVIAGEMRINRFELIPAGQTATDPNGETEANSAGHAEGEPKANAQGEIKAKGELIPKDLRENSPQSIAGSNSLPFLPSEEPETSAIIEAVESLRARTGKPLKYDVRVSGDYIEVAISPRGIESEVPTSPPGRPPDSSPRAPDSIAPILEAFLPAGGISESDARRIHRNCPGYTAEDVAARATQEIPGLLEARRRKTLRATVVGVLLKQLPEFFQGDGAVMWRRDRQTKADEAAAEERNSAEQEREAAELYEKFVKEEVEKAGGSS